MDLQQRPPSTLPDLDKPGAGVPWYHRLLFRFILKPFVASRSNWNASEQLFHKISTRILKEIENLTDKQMAARILVPPQMALEDSSRYWSVAMALEHMVIVGESITAGIVELSAGRIPPIKADPGKVKPVGLMSPSEAKQEFTFFVTEDYKKFLQQVNDRTSKTTLYHPWFGPMNAHQWFWLLSSHQAIHLKQIREIKKRLSVIE